MSTTSSPPATSSESDPDPDPVVDLGLEFDAPPRELDGEALRDALFDAPGVCNWCFGRKRRYYQSHEQAVAEYLYREGRGGALRCRGHTPTSDGTLMVDGTATSDADPGTFCEVVPPRTDERGQVVELPRAYTICECGVIDYDTRDSRTVRQLVECVEHIDERLEEVGIPFDAQAAIALVDELKDRGALGTNDDPVLAHAIRLGRARAERRREDTPADAPRSPTDR